DLRAAPLEGLTIGAALQRLVRRGANEERFQAEFRVEGADRPLSPRIEGGLYRVAQEALTNAARHAHARRGAGSLELTDTIESGGGAGVTIEDDGAGFDVERPLTGHFGLIGMRERARLLGGTLDIASEPGGGTCVVLDLPLEG